MPSKRVGQLSGFGDLLHRRRLFSGFEIQDGVLVLLPLRKSFSISFRILHVWLSGCMTDEPSFLLSSLYFVATKSYQNLID